MRTASRCRKSLQIYGIRCTEIFSELRALHSGPAAGAGPTIPYEAMPEWYLSTQ